MPSELTFNSFLSAAALQHPFELHVKETDTVYELKQKIEENLDVNVDEMVLR